MYHIELRAFPRQVQQFNLSGQELGAIVLAWVQERVVEVGEVKWSPHQATLTIIEGPQLAMERISMGRGWQAAQREGEDVTERVLSEGREALASGAAGQHERAPGQGAGVSAPAPAAAADPLALGVELASLLGPDPTALLSAWRAVAVRAPDLSPSESLALAERELRSPGGGDGR